MATEYGALCTDFAISQRLNLRMDLPTERETLLSLFDRIRKERPAMNRLRRYNGEVALESAENRSNYEWLALRRTSIRSGSVNPDSIEDAAALHRVVLRVTPYFLTISPLDVESLELGFGFDIEADVDRNEAVFDALLAGSPLAQIVDDEREPVVDCQPLLTFTLDQEREIDAVIDVKTRMRRGEGRDGRYDVQPITIDAAVKSSRPLNSIDDLPLRMEELFEQVRLLADERVIPRLLMPIREVILSRPS